MQVSFPIAIYCLHVLLTSFTPVYSKVTYTKSDSMTVEGNKPFTLWCKATEIDDEKIVGKFTWTREASSSSVTEVPLLEDSNNITETLSEGGFRPGNLIGKAFCTAAILWICMGISYYNTHSLLCDKRSITSTLTVTKPPRIFGGSFYYVCSFGAKKNFISVRLLRDGELPDIQIVNETDSRISSIVTKFGKIVKLICLVSYKNIDASDKVKLDMSWKHEDGKPVKSFARRELVGGNTLRFNTTVVVKSSDVGGNYSCHSRYVFRGYTFHRISSVELNILPQINGDTAKEVKEVAGNDVKLQCDIVGYPVEYKWQFQDGTEITDTSRYSVTPTVLEIDDITYDDRKKYVCIGNYNNGEQIIKQTITLRVKDPLAPLWPFIGILAELFVVLVIIYGTEYYKNREDSEKDGGDRSIDEPASTTCA